MALFSSKIILQPSSQSCPADKSEALLRLSSTYPVFASRESKGCKVVLPCFVMVPSDLSGNPTYDVGIRSIFFKHRASSGLM